MEFVLQVALVTLLLTLLGGVTQALPWGLGSAQQFRQRASAVPQESADQEGPVVDVTTKPLVTEEFDRLTVDQVSTLTTDRSFSWIVSRPIGYYNPSRYLAFEVFTQLLVALGLVTLRSLLNDLEQHIILLATFVLAAVASVATYGQLSNWWGLTARYVAGVAFTLVVGWVASMWLILLIWS